VQALLGLPWACLQLLEKMRKNGVMLPNNRRLFLSVLWLEMGSNSPCTGENLQKPASKSLLEMLQKTTKVKENFCFYTEIFCIKISTRYKYLYDLFQVFENPKI
jgi:hypothetical protein